jgi:putative intracellular protease/amidase
MNIAIPIFDELTALDAVGPYEVLSRLPGATVTFIAADPGPKRTENKMLALVADRSLDELPHPEVIVVPGGFGTRALTHDETMLDWLRAAHETSTWTTSVCTGALLLAAAGILDGLEATTHWLAMDELSAYGAIPVQRRVVEQGLGRHGAAQDRRAGPRPRLAARLSPPLRLAGRACRSGSLAPQAISRTILPSLPPAWKCS